VLRSRVIYQTAVEQGRSVEEMQDKAAAREIAMLWEHVAGLLEAVGRGADGEETAAAG
jgi:chromosome partitioning protein